MARSFSSQCLVLEIPGKMQPVFSTKKIHAAGKSLLPPRLQQRTQRNISKRRNCHTSSLRRSSGLGHGITSCIELMQLRRRRGCWKNSYPLHCLSRGSDVTTNVLFKAFLIKKMTKNDQKGQGIDSIEKVQVSLCQEGRLFFSSTIYCCQIIFPTHSV